MEDDYHYNGDKFHTDGLNEFHKDWDFEDSQDELESDTVSSYSWKKVGDEVKLIGLKIVGCEKIHELKSVNPQVIEYIEFQLNYIHNHQDDHGDAGTEVFDMDSVHNFHTGELSTEYDYNSLLACTWVLDLSESR